MSLVSYLPPLPPPLHTPQLTETWQWPTCMCWQLKLTLLFWSHRWDWGKSCPLPLFHPWNPAGIQCCPVPLEQALPVPGVPEPALCSVLIPSLSAGLLLALPCPAVPLLAPCVPPGAVLAVPGLGTGSILQQLQKESPMSCLVGWIPPALPQHPAGWPLLPSVPLPCSAGAAGGVCDLLCISCTVPLSYPSTGCFS